MSDQRIKDFPTAEMKLQIQLTYKKIIYFSQRCKPTPNRTMRDLTSTLIALEWLKISRNMYSTRITFTTYANKAVLSYGWRTSQPKTFKKLRRKDPETSARIYCERDKF